jgi:hypothetical protein
LGISFYYTIPRQVFPPETARFGRASVKPLPFHARISSKDRRLVFEPRECLIPAGNQNLNLIFAFSERFAYKMRIRNKSGEVEVVEPGAAKNGHRGDYVRKRDLYYDGLNLPGSAAHPEDNSIETTPCSTPRTRTARFGRSEVIRSYLRPATRVADLSSQQMALGRDQTTIIERALA